MLEDGVVECLACSWRCKIKKNGVGICGVRVNNEGKLKLMVDNQAVGLSPDPIEKKPLFHFLPGSKALSFGTLGCNFDCAFCQNWFQSQAAKKLKGNREGLKSLINKYSVRCEPEEVVRLAKDKGCQSIAYTYNEPAVFVEYALKTMKLARTAGLKNVWVSNGFESDESIKSIVPYLDAINIDIKSLREGFYRKICVAKIEPVLRNIRKIFKTGVWLELTTLIIPDENDSKKELKEVADFMAGLSVDIPWHVTAFRPDYKMRDKDPTDGRKLEEAWEIGKKAGLNYVYVGNVPNEEHSKTVCPQCNNLLIERVGYAAPMLPRYTSGSSGVPAAGAEKEGLEEGKCKECGEKIAGVWK